MSAVAGAGIRSNAVKPAARDEHLARSPKPEVSRVASAVSGAANPSREVAGARRLTGKARRGSRLAVCDRGSNAVQAGAQPGNLRFKQAPRLCARDERFLDGVGRPGLGHLAGSAVDRHEDDVVRGDEAVGCGAVLDVRLHELPPDRERYRGAVLAVAERALLVEPHPGPHGDVRVEADEPAVGVVIDRAGLAAQGPAKRAGADPGAAVDHPAEDIQHHIGGIGAGWHHAHRAGSPRAPSHHGRRSW